MYGETFYGRQTAQINFLLTLQFISAAVIFKTFVCVGIMPNWTHNFMHVFLRVFLCKREMT